MLCQATRPLFRTSALGLVWQNSALAEAMASFSGHRSFRIVLFLQRWPHFRASARSEPCSCCSGGVILLHR
eukprot:8006033-Pyramimonas_sp.AAC.1